MARLGVNIDHIATLREARKESYPSLTDAVTVILKNGAHLITMHLREDRRHIQDKDLLAVINITKSFNCPLNLEMGPSDEILNIALKLKPEHVCLVPERSDEVTTEGGLDLLSNEIFNKVQKTTTLLQKNGSKVSLFLAANTSLIDAINLIHPYGVEVYTGEFAKLFKQGKDYSSEINKFKDFKKALSNTSLHAGHGLTLTSLKELQTNRIFSEYNIGHAIIADSLFFGLAETITKYVEAAT